MLSFREIVDVVSERRPQDLSTRDSTPTSMLIVRFAMTRRAASVGTSQSAEAVIAESGTSPKCFLTRLSRSYSSLIVRGEHRIRVASR